MARRETARAHTHSNDNSRFSRKSVQTTGQRDDATTMMLMMMMMAITDKHAGYDAGTG